MKRLFVLLACLLAVPAQGQILSIIMGGTNQPAATPTFSPVAGAVTNPTTVTASTSTSDGCTIYFDTSNPPVTAQTTYSVTTGVTLYAQARGCAHHSDSAVGSAAYTISASCSTSGIIAKYDADSLSATPVTVNWPDTSGNGYDMPPVASPTWANGVFGTHAGVSLNGTTQYFECSSTCGSGTGIVPGTNVTIYAVITVSNISGYPSIITTNVTGPGIQYRLNGGHQDFLWEGNADLGTSTGALSINTHYVATVTYNHTTGAGAFYLNNSANGTFTATAPSLAFDTLGYVFPGTLGLITVTNTTYDSTYQACLVSGRL
jgi:hypothetical protein